jgi:TonB family protein
MLKRICTTMLAVVVTALILFSLSSNNFAQSGLTAKAKSFQPQQASVLVESDRIKDGLIGPVRRVRTEVVKLASVDGRLVEGKRALLEVVAYDIKGNKVENQYFPVAGGTITGKEVYKYDDKGNISEMTLLNDDGSLESRETYKYEFDFAGNWNKMTASVAVVDGGKFTFEPTEITYRAIMYYLDENMVKMAQPAARPNPTPAPPSTSSNTVAKVNSEPKVEAEDLPSKQPAASRKSTQILPPASNMSGTLTNSAELRTVSMNPSTNSPVVELESEPPPSPSPRPILKSVSGGVLNGMALSLPAPAYPETAKRMRVAGTVSVGVVIDEDGKVISAEASGGPVTLREAAVKAALRARFSPPKLSGQPVKVSGVINYKFALTQ